MKQILSLPNFTPHVVVNIVSESLPAEAKIDQKVLSLFDNVTLQYI